MNIKNSISTVIFIIIANLAFGQTLIPKAYLDFVKKADSLYKAKDYKNAAFTYSSAFKANDWKPAPVSNRYNAACSWALANYPDSAFYQLNRIVTKGNYINYEQITTDADLNSLHNDKRWQPLLELIQQNKYKAEVIFKKPLVQQLDSIRIEDQKYRQMIKGIGQKYGYESKEMKDLWKIINKKDSINLIKITGILDKYGWLGLDIVGQEGSITLFLVIQHADQKTQEKYLPMMREAVKAGKAQGNQLALLEDRVALGQGKKQIYGSQIHRDNITGKYFVAPIEDESNVNKRRAEVGLEPLEVYAKGVLINFYQSQPHVRNKAPACPVLSPAFRNERPAFRTKATAFPVLSPAFCNKATAFPVLSPAFCTKAPAFPVLSPAFRNERPAFRTKTTAFPVISPAFRTKATAFLLLSPAFCNEVPAFRNKATTTPILIIYIPLLQVFIPFFTKSSRILT